MKVHITPQAGDPAGNETGCGTNPPRRILVVDADRGIPQSSVTVRIRHQTSLKNTSLNPNQSQAGNASPERQL